MVSGLFFAIAVISYGVRRFRVEQINNPYSDIKVGRWWEIVISVLVPLQAVVLIIWWIYQVRGEGWLNPFGVENLGTIIFQWGIVLVGLIVANRVLLPRITAMANRDEEVAQSESTASAS